MVKKLSDPLLPLLEEADLRALCGDDHNPILWRVGNQWVEQTGPDKWTTGPDEPATADEVRNLLEK